MTSETPKLEDARRVVVKIGSALLVDEASRKVRRGIDCVPENIGLGKIG